MAEKTLKGTSHLLLEHAGLRIEAHVTQLPLIEVVLTYSSKRNITIPPKKFSALLERYRVIKERAI